MSIRSPKPALLFCGLLSAGLWLLLTLISHGKIAPLAGFDPALPNDEMPTRSFLLIHFLLAALAVLPLFISRNNLHRLPLPAIVGAAILFRLIALPGAPIHENDFNRYLWDGKLAVHGINPHRFPPADLSDPRVEALRDGNPALHDGINHPDIATIYPPMAQAVFAFSSMLFGDSLIALKCLLLGFDLGILALVIALLRQLKLPTALALLYAWHPVVVKEVANSAHYDVVPVFFTVLAVFFAVRSRNRWTGALSLAAGTLAKYFSVLLLPILHPPRDSKNSLLSWALFAAVMIAGFIPFIFWDEAGVERVFSGLGAYHRDWTFYPGAFTVLLLIAQSAAMAKAIAALLLAATVVLLSLTRTADPINLARKCCVAIAALLVLSPTAYPWYFLWLLPFLCLFPSRAWLLLSFLAPLTYLSFRGDSLLANSYLLNIPSLTWITWGIFAIAWFIEKRHCQPLFPPPSSQEQKS